MPTDPRLLPCLVLALCGLARAQAPAAPAAGGADELAPAAQHLLDAAVADGSTALARWDEVWRAAVAAHGGTALLQRALIAASAADRPAPQRAAAQVGLCQARAHDGRLGEALAALDRALEAQRSDALAMRRAQLLDALDRKGEASAEFERLAGSTTDRALAAQAQLRLALLQQPPPEPAPLDAAASKPSKPKPGEQEASKPSALFTAASRPDYAEQQKDNAAVVLALLGRPREALQLFGAEGDGSQRFRQEVRMAEWALAAGDASSAQTHAWLARGAASVRRDRMYALTLLVEAHRRDQSIDKLIDRFAGTAELDAESRQTWIDLLRETARVDEALALFKQDAAFTPEMRRELLAICREAGRDEELIATYDRMILEEPQRLEWRVGLSRYWLEQGKRQEAVAVWDSFVQQGHDANRWLQAAEATRDLGLDDLAGRYGEQSLQDEGLRMRGRLFLFDFLERHGDIEAALQQLDAFDKEAPADAAGRVQLAEAYQRIGKKRRAVEVLEALRAVRGADNAEEDLEMRLCWMHSEIGEEDIALQRWRELWQRVDSKGRRRQIEDRLIATASRLGKLADIAVELEVKLSEHKASERDAGLLVRIYQKVNDPVSAAEILDEYMQQSGGDAVKALEDKAQIYLQGKDYFHFEQAVKQLLEVDPENRGDHMRQLAMSDLERGKPQQARLVLAQLAKEENPSDAAEFEAGVLTLAGLNEEAAKVYRQGLAAHPERIDTWLLLGNAMKSLGRTNEAIGMFAQLAETADKDDLFTVAVDGLLNMRAKEPQLRFALRLVLARLAQNHDRLYLYQLAADLFEELNDTQGRLRAIEGALPSSGEQRAQLLRELMDVARGRGTGSYTVVQGMVVERRGGGDEPRRLAYGRRLIGLGDAVPPQVYLELGDAFLAEGDIANAQKTFARARDLPDYGAFQRQVAESFEREGYLPAALEIYERAMASQGLDDKLLLKTGELNEILGRDDRAVALYQRGLEVMLARFPQSGAAKQAEENDPWDWQNRNANVTSFETCYVPMRTGFLATATAPQVQAFVAAQTGLLAQDLAAVVQEPDDDKAPRLLPAHLRVMHRGALIRELLLRHGQTQELQQLDLRLLAAFPRDEELLPKLVEELLRYGHAAVATAVVEQGTAPAPAVGKARLQLPKLQPEGGAAVMSLADVGARLLPLLADGDREAVVKLLRSVRIGELKAEDLQPLRLLVTAAVFDDDDTSIVALGRQLMRATVANARKTNGYQSIDGVLQRVRSALDEPSFNLIVQALIEAALQDRQLFRRISYTFTQLQRQLGRPLLTAEQLKEQLAACLPDEPYMVQILLQLLPAQDRLEALQKLWPNVPPTERVDIATGLLRMGRRKVPTELQDFVLGVVADALGRGDPKQLESTIGYLDVGAPANAAFVRKLVELVMTRQQGSLQLQALHAAACQKAGAAADAQQSLKATLELLSTAPLDGDRRYEVSRATQRLVDAFVPESAEALLQAIDQTKATGDNAVGLLQLKVLVFDRLGDDDRKVRALEAGLKLEPKSMELLQQLYYELQGRGDAAESIAVLQRLVEAEPQSRWRSQLSYLWLSRRNPIEALRCRDERDKEKADAKAKARAEKTEAVTLELLAKTAKAGEAEHFAALYRRAWRDYSVQDRSQLNLGYYGGAPAWPEEAEDKPEAPERRRSRGGLDALREPDQRPEAKERPTLYDGISQYDCGLEPLRLQVMLADPTNLPKQRALLRGLQRAEFRRGGEAVVAGWRQGAASGDRLCQSLLLSWFEDHIDELSSSDRELVATLLPAVQPLDGGQLRAFAAICARLGDKARASRLYQWIACTAASSRYYYDPSGSLDPRSLIPEVRKYLAGDELEDAVAAILQRSDPGPGNWEHDSYTDLAITTWLEVGGAELAAKRAAPQLAAVLDTSQGVLRQAAIPAARVYIAAGELDHAERAMEVALCRFQDVPTPYDPDETMVVESGGISAEDLRWLLPKGQEHAAWIDRAAAAIDGWRQQKRLSESAQLMLYGGLCQRLCELQRPQEAQALLPRLQEFHSASARHMLLDCARLCGDTALAEQVQGELLASQSLNVERLREVVEARRQAAGDKAALQFGEQLAAWAPHPQLVELLLQLAAGLPDEAALQRLTKLREDCLAAAKELDTTW